MTKKVYACPECGAPTDERHGKHGTFLGCVNYPECKGILNLHRGKPVDPVQECPDCGAESKLRLGRYGPFFGCTNYPECKTILKMKFAKKWEVEADETKRLTNADKSKKKRAESKSKSKTKFDEMVKLLDTKQFILQIQTDPMKSKHGSGGLENAGPDHVWVTHINKTSLKFIGIDVVESFNRYGGWYYKISRADLEKFPYVNTMDMEKNITMPETDEYKLAVIKQELLNRELTFDGKVFMVLTLTRTTLGRSQVSYTIKGYSPITKKTFQDSYTDSYRVVEKMFYKVRDAVYKDARDAQEAQEDEQRAIDRAEREISIAERDYEEDSQQKTGEGPL